MRTIGERTNVRPAYTAAAFLLLALALFGPARARAQWTTTGTNTTTTNNVGVGSNAAPQSQLDVTGSDLTVRATFGGTTGANGKFQLFSKDIVNNPFGEIQMYAPTGAGSEYFRINLRNSSNTVYADAFTIGRTGNVGIGTASPGSPLDVVYNDNNLLFGVNVRNVNPGSLALVGYGLNNAGGSRVGQFIYVSPNYATASMRDSVLISSVGATAKLGFVSSAEGSGTPDIYFRAGGSRPDSLYIQGSTGNVGVGTTNPTESLDVVGNITASGNISAKYQDVAEWVPSTQQLAAGTVVVLDAGRTNHVLASTAAYDTKVAGVVSEQPGVILGVPGEGKVKVATTGRVLVRVDATRGAIHVGDLLVTSDVEGVAMKSVPVELGGRQFHAPGTIIGKALEPLEKGTGRILVLLSLQ